VIEVSWDDGTTYCQWADKHLPTEACCTKAARGILTPLEEGSRKYPWGNEEPTGELANSCDGNCPFEWKDESIDDAYADTSPVGSYPAGATLYGAFDMAGNVWEWVNDWYDKNYYGTSPRDNPRGPSVEGKFRVMRGGSWYSVAWGFRGSDRGWGVASARNDYRGFRCAASDS
jgi:formylglycine-generating enzyme required for sulfatase activity